MQTSPQSGSHEKLLQAILLIAACFAIGSVGFFLAVFLQKNAATTQVTGTLVPVADQVPTSTKEQVLESLSDSPAADTNTSASNSASTSATSSSSQATDASTAAKLKALQSLSTQ